MDMYWLGLGIAIAGYFIGSGLQELGSEIRSGLWMMRIDVSLDEARDEEEEVPNETCA
jgi:hypothetical protein